MPGAGNHAVVRGIALIIRFMGVGVLVIAGLLLIGFTLLLAYSSIHSASGMGSWITPLILALRISSVFLAAGLLLFCGGNILRPEVKMNLALKAILFIILVAGFLLIASFSFLNQQLL